MEITKINVVPIQNHNRLKASVTIVLDGVFKVRSIKILPRKGGEGLYVSFPDTRNAKGEYFALAYPLTREFRREVESAILGEYQKVISEQEQSEEPASEIFDETFEDPNEL